MSWCIGMKERCVRVKRRNAISARRISLQHTPTTQGIITHAHNVSSFSNVLSTYYIYILCILSYTHRRSACKWIPRPFWFRNWPPWYGNTPKTHNRMAWLLRVTFAWRVAAKSWTPMMMVAPPPWPKCWARQQQQCKAEWCICRLGHVNEGVASWCRAVFWESSWQPLSVPPVLVACLSLLYPSSCPCSLSCLCFVSKNVWLADTIIARACCCRYRALSGARIPSWETNNFVCVYAQCFFFVWEQDKSQNYSCRIIFNLVYSSTSYY